ncbi:MAG: hypothetical protein QW407_04225 [Thermofilaceae archaeon]
MADVSGKPSKLIAWFSGVMLVMALGFLIAEIPVRIKSGRLDITFLTDTTTVFSLMLFSYGLSSLVELKKPEWKPYPSLYAAISVFVVTTLWLGVQAYYALTGKQAHLLGIPTIGLFWLFSLLSIIVKGYTLRSSSRVQ